MTMKLLVGVTMAALVVSGSAWAQDKASQSFLTEAIQGNLAEVQMGHLAQKNGSSDAVNNSGRCL